MLIDGFAPKEGNQTYFLLRMQPGPKWIAGKPLSGQNVGEHFAYMTAKAGAGVVAAAGPDASGREGWYVVRGARPAADALVAGDPGVRDGLFKPALIGWNVIDMQASRR